LIKLGYKFYDNYRISKHINNLPDFIVPTNETPDNKNKELTCYICFDELKLGKKLNCGHIFHLRCIKEWVTSSVGCPLCKVPVTNEKKPVRRFGGDDFAIEGGNGEGEGFNNQVANDINADNENDYTNNRTNTSTSLFNAQSNGPLLQKFNPDFKKLKMYNQILKISNWIENNNNFEPADSSMSNISTGSVSYSLPCAAIYNRTVTNEIKRLEIENYNRKILEIYDNPLAALSRYEEEILSNITK
jgi:hypothetical protein